MRSLLVFASLLVATSALAADPRLTLDNWKAAPKPSPKPPGAFVPPQPSGDAMVDELNRKHAEMQQAYDNLNKMNPMSADYAKGGAAGAPAPTGPFAEMQKLLGNPAVQSYLSLFKSKAFADGASAVMNHPARVTLGWAELGLFIFMLFFRAWRFSKASHWLRRVWVNLYTVAMGWTLGTIVLPAVILGDPYVNVLKGLYETFSKQ